MAQLRAIIGSGVRALAVTATVALVATACASGGSSSNSKAQPSQKVQPVTPKEPTGPVTITFASRVGDSPQMKKLAADFHKAHPNITVKFQNVPAESATQKLTTEIAGGTTGLFYRTDLFQAAGITSAPTTWDELQAANFYAGLRKYSPKEYFNSK